MIRNRIRHAKKPPGGVFDAAERFFAHPGAADRHRCSDLRSLIPRNSVSKPFMMAS